MKADTSKFLGFYLPVLCDNTTDKDPCCFGRLHHVCRANSLKEPSQLTDLQDDEYHVRVPRVYVVHTVYDGHVQGCGTCLRKL